MTPRDRSQRNVPLTELDSSLKRCSKCGKNKPLDQFNRRSDHPDQYRSHCKSCIKAYREANKEAFQEWRRRHREINRERLNEWVRQWRKDNPDVTRAWSEKYYKEHREKFYLANRNRRARVNGGDGTHTTEDVRCKYEEQGGKCYWCGKPLDGVYHVDHIVPVSKGGGNGPGNICCACPPCNLSKHNKMPWEFSDRLF